MDDVNGRENEEEVIQGNNKRRPEPGGNARGILAHSTHDTLPGAAIAGALVGSAWASAALLCTCLVAVCSGNDFVTARWAMSLVIAFVACGVLQRASFDCRKTDGWSYERSVITFGVALYVVLTLCALVGAWLPAGNASAWLLLTAIYAMVLALLAFAFKAGDGWYDGDAEAEDDAEGEE